MIPTTELHLEVAAQSHAGETGKNNEDAFFYSGYRLESDGTPAVVAIVADGVGGHRAGEIASRLAVDTASKRISEASGADPISQIRAAIVEAGRTISTASEALPEQQGMASTIAVVWVIGSRLYTAYTGDSRIYLLRGGRLQQTTIDHSWIQEAIEHKIITPVEARTHPNAHILRRYLGGNVEPQPDFRLRLESSDSDGHAIEHQGTALEPGDQILLCTDGLTDLVRDEEIRAALLKGPPAESTAALVVLARARGGHDNITTIVLGVPGTPGATPRRRAPRFVVIGAAVLALIVTILLGLAAAWTLGFWPWG